ncbi:ribosome maturation factor RimP [soil metagenome]
MGLVPIFYGREIKKVIVKNVQSPLNTVLEQAVIALGYEYVGHQYFPRGKTGTLRVYIDTKEGGVTVEDCSKASRQINAVLNVENVLQSDYVLEVSSPGIERPLFTIEQLQQSVGKQVQIRLQTLNNARRNLVGILQNVSADNVMLQVEKEEIVLPLADIEKANLVAELKKGKV